MEDLFFENGNKKITFYHVDVDNEICIDIEEYNSHYFYLDKEKVIKLKNHLEEVLKIMASNA